MTIIDWIEITITFNTKCNECGKYILPGKAFWSTSAKAAKHLSCGKTNIQMDKGNSVLQDIMEVDHEFVKSKPVAELQCFVCGKKTGCNECEYLEKCEARTVSKYCICKECSIQEESFYNYQQSFADKIMKFLK
jgi:hypothetical protein